MIKQTKITEEELEALEGITLAMAQSEIQAAMDEIGLKPFQVAERSGRPRPFISRILHGNHNLTIRTMARVFAACGFEVRFGRTPICATSASGWTATRPETTYQDLGDAGRVLMCVIPPLTHLGTLPESLKPAA
jgi:transcriptional regulator with XRE-family HTH domain